VKSVLRTALHPNTCAHEADAALAAARRLDPHLEILEGDPSDGRAYLDQLVTKNNQYYERVKALTAENTALVERDKSRLTTIRTLRAQIAELEAELARRVAA
jgi:recombinational DNA repair ATPase RecF